MASCMSAAGLSYKHDTLRPNADVASDRVRGAAIMDGMLVMSAVRMPVVSRVHEVIMVVALAEFAACCLGKAVIDAVGQGAILQHTMSIRGATQGPDWALSMRRNQLTMKA